MTFCGTGNRTYETGRELGRGGEGCVCEVLNETGLVLKQYFEPVPTLQSEKLRQMVRMKNEAIEAYAAWPMDVVTNPQGQTTGFTMKKLNGYVPLHHLFSPMDRKKMFPDKGFNFLVHVARNLATAFHTLHHAGLVMGDVNEGNILVNAKGYVCLIDCDSFQVARDDGKGYFFCEVGVPRYTPPELLKLSTFSDIVRSKNTDNFSLAILIFQLLFLGRHPFAGKTKAKAELDEERAIKALEFAYTLRRKRPRLTPPPDSFPITGLNEPLIEMFHQAFEEKDRPEPIEWVRGLEALLSDMQVCTLTPLHTYPAVLKECPWCRFRKDRGILYFLDDSYLNATRALGDIEQFVQGFQVQPLALPEFKEPALPVNVTALPVDTRFVQARNMHAALMTAATMAELGSIFFAPALILAPLAGMLLLQLVSPWKKLLAKEQQTLADAVANQKNHLSRLLLEQQHTSDQTNYYKHVAQLERAVADFRNLPVTTEEKRQKMEEELYREQLGYYLACFKIDNHQITAIGTAKKAVLLQHGIENANDISRVGAVKVPGIGPKNQQILMEWQRSVAAGFQYIPDAQKVSLAQKKAENEMYAKRGQLENQIRKSFQEVNYLRDHLQHRHRLLENRINDQAKQAARAQANLDAFVRMRNFNLLFATATLTRLKARQ